MNAGQNILIFLVRLYRALVSPIFTFIFGASGLGCRFTPTCSQYALDALRAHGAAKGALLSAHRICRCHPWGGSGHDPVPAHWPKIGLAQRCFKGQSVEVPRAQH
ncbi:MAG TPA: membrane protein insertion efficiency factor YidD [Candidatus Saccharimonadales bacterium]|nr:membrane protein insertion efficiency factor YidD [Candidatus Saccharimonadales bacterium]